jgi:hypothetical protein
MKIILIFILWVTSKSAVAQDSSWIMKSQIQKQVILKSFNNLPPVVLNKSFKCFNERSSEIIFKNFFYVRAIKVNDKAPKEYISYVNEQSIFNINNTILIKKPELTQGQLRLNTVGGIVGGILNALLTDYSQENRITH